MFRRMAAVGPSHSQLGYYPMGVHYHTQPPIHGNPGQALAAGIDRPFLFYDEFEQLGSASQVAGPAGYYDHNNGLGYSPDVGYAMHPYGTTPPTTRPFGAIFHAR